MSKEITSADTKSAYQQCGSIIASFGYLGFEFGIQGYPKNAKFLENLVGIDERVLRHHGSDFFGAASLTYGLGGYATKFLHSYTKKKNLHGVSEFIEKNYRTTRSALVMTFLTAHEIIQGQAKGRSFDTGDLAAYALGITALCHAEDVGKYFWKNVNFVFGKNKSYASSNNKPNYQK